MRPSRSPPGTSTALSLWRCSSTSIPRPCAPWRSKMRQA
jgi:hypothetical protein